MKKINVNLSSFYGCDCMGCGYDNHRSVVIEVDDMMGEKLQSFMKEKGYDGITRDMLHDLMMGGEVWLKEIGEEIRQECINMDIDYWLEEAEYADVDFHELMHEDMASGEFKPKYSFEDYVKDNEIDTDGEDYDEDVTRCDYEDEHALGEYKTWLFTLDRHEHAERVGLDIDGVIEQCDSDYVIVGVE